MPTPPTADGGMTFLLRRPTHAERLRLITTYADARQFASELGLCLAGQRVAEADQWAGSPSEVERDLAASLLDEAEVRALSANAASYLGKLKTFLHWMAIFRDVFPTRRLVLPLGGPDHVQNAIFNEDTKALVQMVMRKHGSIAKGREGTTIEAGHLAAVTSTFTSFTSLMLRHKTSAPNVNELLPRLQRSLRKEDGPTGARALMEGIEPHHIEAADATGRYDRTSQAGIVYHALALLLINVVGRGGEAGIVEGKAQASFDPSVGFVWADIEWSTPADALRLNDGLPFFRCWWFPIKDFDARRRKVPTPVSRRSASARDDPRCAYSAVLAAWQARAHRVPPDRRASEPFFRLPNGKIATTKTVRETARNIARLVDIDPDRVGAKSFRIGGGFALRDWCEMHRMDAERLLRERGRWNSDIGYIYARMSDRVHLSGSRGIAQADSAHATESNTGWAQPSR